MGVRVALILKERTPPIGHARFARQAAFPRQSGGRDYFGARLARIRCKVRRCMFSRRAVSETLWPHSS